MAQEEVGTVCYTQAGMYFVLQVALVQDSEAELYLYMLAPGAATSCCQLLLLLSVRGMT